MTSVDDTVARIPSSFDRFQEAHFWIHSLEHHYHVADPFRWYLNSFLRTIKEVPQLLQMELQNDVGFATWYRPFREALEADPLIAALSRHRNYVVHRSALIPRSSGAVGITELRGMKLGMSFPVHPLENSSDAMDRYLRHAGEHGDFLGILILDEDSVPCVERVWRLPEFDEEIVEVCARAWLRVGETMAHVLRWLGAADVPLLSLECRHSSQRVQFMLFNRNKLIARTNKIAPPSKDRI